MIRSKKYIKKNNVKFKDANNEEIAFYCNGCGSSKAWIKVPDFVFCEACNQHDWNYEFFCPTEAERAKADWQFYEAMKKAAGNNRFYKAWAWVYYEAVRLGGSDKCSSLN